MIRFSEARSTVEGPYAVGLVREVDLSDDLWGQMAKPLQDPDYFHQVRVDTELETVIWPNGYDLDHDHDHDHDHDLLHGDHESVGRPAVQTAH